MPPATDAPTTRPRHRAPWGPLGRAIARLAACLVLAAAPALAQLNTWVPAGPDYGGVLAFERDPANSQAIYAGTFFGGLYRSLDNGTTWSYVPSPADGVSVQAIAFDAARPGTFFIGTLGTGLFRTTDGGATWQAANQGLEELNISAIAIDPFDDNRVLVATGQGAFVSLDAGGTWQRLATGGTLYDVFTLAFDPARSGHLYLGTVSRAVVRSTDNGATWQQLADGMGNYTVKALRFDPRGNKLFAASFAVSFGKVFTLALGGGATTWQDISNNLPNSIVNDVILNPANPDRVFAFSDFGVYELLQTSTFGDWSIRGFFAGRTALWNSAGTKLLVATLDRGVLAASNNNWSGWAPANRGLQNLFVEALGTSTRGGLPNVLAGTDIGVSVSTNRGAAWANNGTFLRTIFDIQAHPQDPSIVFSGTERNGLWKSTDGGANWVPKSTGIVPPGVGVVAQAPTGSRPLYAGTAAGLFVSRDSGASWNVATQVPIFDVRSVAFDPFRPGAAFFGTGDGKVHITLDDGVSIFPGGTGLPPSPVVSLAVTAVNAVFPVVYAVTASGQLFTSTDDARTWSELNTGTAAPALAVLVRPAFPATLFIATGGAGVRRSDDLGATWVAANDGIDTPFVFTLATDGSGANLFAAGRGRIFKSADAGAHWTPVSAGITDNPVSRIVADAGDDNVLYAFVSGQGIVKTANGGGLWNPVSAGPPAASILSIGTNPAAPAQLYAGTALEGVFKSADAGASFAPSSIGLTLFVRGIAIHPSNPSLMYAASLFGGMFRSTDGGESWRASGLANRVIHKVTLDPSDPDTVFAATAGGVGRSRDGGATWTILGQRSAFVSSLLAVPSTTGPGTLYVGGTNAGLFRSTDGGASYADVNAGLPVTNVHRLARNPTNGALYAVLEGQGVYESRDEAASWRRILDPAFIGRAITSFAVHPATGAFYASTDGAGVVSSSNGGATWEFMGTGLVSFDVRQLALDPVSGNLLHAATAGGVFSIDLATAGEPWRRTAAAIPGEPPVNVIVVDERRPGVLYAATDAGVYLTTDRGATWRSANQGLGASRVNALAIDPCSVATIYAGTNGDGIYRSTDGGSSWTPVNSGLGSGVIRALATGSEPDTVFAGTVGSGVQKSVNAGASWTGNLEGTVLPVVHALGLSARRPGLVYAGTGDFGAFRSVNGGLDWQRVNNGLTDVEIFSMTVHPANPRVVYVGTRTSGVFRTVDGGASWTQLPTAGLFVRFVVALALDPQDPNILYAGTEGGGVFRMTLDPPPPGVPDPPTGVAVATGNGQATVSFSPPGFDGGSPVTGYTVTAMPGSIAVQAGASPVTVTGLVNGTRYTFTVRANNAVGPGEASPATAPRAPASSPLAPFMLELTLLPAAAGSVVSSPLGLQCVASCAASFAPDTLVHLKATPSANLEFAQWTGCDTCDRTRCVVRMDGLRQVRAGFTLDPKDDFDRDGVPNGVEGLEGLDPLAKDNDIFSSARLFAMQQYRDFLGREGDAAGVDFWTGQIVAGTRSSSQVIASFFDSAEFAQVNAKIARLYFAYFLRVPDYEGLQFWVARYRAGDTLDAISGAFAASPESIARYGSLDDAAFVTLVYQNVLGRPPEPAGLAFWLERLADGRMTRGQVMIAFSESPEYGTAVASEVYVTLVYLGMLRRAPEPSGFAFWLGYLDAGNDALALVGAMLGTAEYRLRFLPP